MATRKTQRPKRTVHKTENHKQIAHIRKREKDKQSKEKDIRTYHTSQKKLTKRINSKHGPYSRLSARKFYDKYGADSIGKKKLIHQQPPKASVYKTLTLREDGIPYWK